MEWANWLSKFIQDVGFPIVVVVGIVGLLGWISHRLGQFCGPLIRQLVSAVMEFLGTTSKSVSVQTDILHVMANDQKHYGSLVTRIHNRIFGDDSDELVQELEDNHGRRGAGSRGAPAADGGGD
jgi:hypothetical protein